MKKIIIIVIVLNTIFNLKAQNQISGQVLEITSNGNFLPVFGANVYWEGTNVGTTTDINGNYSINEAESFPATLSVSYVGYTVEDNVLVENQYIFYLKSSVDLESIIALALLSGVSIAKSSIPVLLFKCIPCVPAPECPPPTAKFP